MAAIFILLTPVVLPRAAANGAGCHTDIAMPILLFYPVSSIQDANIIDTLCSHYVVMTLQLCGNYVELKTFMIQGGTEEKRLLRR